MEGIGEQQERWFHLVDCSISVSLCFFFAPLCVLYFFICLYVFVRLCQVMPENSQIILQGDFFTSHALKSVRDDKISTKKEKLDLKLHILL